MELTHAASPLNLREIVTTFGHLVIYIGNRAETIHYVALMRPAEASGGKASTLIRQRT